MRDARSVARATAIAAVLSGAPSTAVELVTGGDALRAARAAGELVPPGPPDEPGRPGFVRGLVAHTAVSVFWGLVLAVVLPRRRQVLWGAAAGACIAALDMGVIARRFPAIRSLPPLPQLADHLAFGALYGWAIDRGKGDR